MNTQNIVRLEVDDGNGIQVIDIDSGKPFAIVLPLNVGNICFYDTNGNVVEYLRQQLCLPVRTGKYRFPLVVFSSAKGVLGVPSASVPLAMNSFNRSSLTLNTPLFFMSCRI